jgi:tRNA(Ile)-lysidine synthase
MADNFFGTIQRYSLIKKGDKVLVAVSGGPDSMALLLHLFDLSPKLNLTLHIAHLDHALRPDSRRDALFVKNWAAKLKLPVTFKRMVYRKTQIKGSVEEFLRNARLNFLIRTAKAVGADKVALGHNLDDQAETVLMRLLRGTGLSGLCGISLRRPMQSVIFIRPLLETTRSQINGFLKRKGVKPRLDFTNRQDIFLRNKIRRRLIPLLKREYNSNITGVLANLAETTSFDYEYLDQEAKCSLKGNSRRLSLKGISKLHPAILRLKLRQSISCVQGDTRRIGYRHIQEIESLILFRPAGSVVNLPKGLCVEKTPKSLLFFRR